MHSGSCLCGEVAFEIEGEFDAFYLCHCWMCRKDTGSAHAANLFSSTARLRWLAGEGSVGTYGPDASGHARSFCTRCGSALPNLQMDGALLVVPAGCLDGDVPIRPLGHIYYADRANWDEGLENVPRFDGLPPKDES